MIYTHTKTHTHGNAAGARHGTCTVFATRHNFGMPETNFGYHTVPVGLIVVCIRSQFVR